MSKHFGDISGGLFKCLMTPRSTVQGLYVLHESACLLLLTNTETASENSLFLSANYFVYRLCTSKTKTAKTIGVILNKL